MSRACKKNIASYFGEIGLDYSTKDHFFMMRLKCDNAARIVQKPS